MMQRFIRRIINSAGYDLVKMDQSFSRHDREILTSVRDFTMTGPERIMGLINAIKHLVINEIEGSIVECGVWRGGSMMAAALVLKELGQTGRHLHLFDTFEGMTTPTAKDVVFTGQSATQILDRTKRQEGPGIWAGGR